MLTTHQSASEAKENTDHLQLSIPLELVTCSVTFKIFFDPISTPCGHTFDVMGLPPTVKQCPLCRKNLVGMNRNVRNTFVTSALEQFYQMLPRFPNAIKEKINESQSLELTPQMIQQVIDSKSDRLRNQLINMLRFKPEWLLPVVVRLTNLQEVGLLKKMLESDIPMTNEILNAIQPEGPVAGYSLAFVLSESEAGTAYLVKQLQSGVAITSNTLNTQVGNDEDKGISVAFILASCQDGIEYLEMLRQRGISITTDTLNVTLGEGSTSAIALAHYLAKFIGGIFLLHKLMESNVCINSENLNRTVSSGELKDECIAFILLHSIPGIDLLFKLTKAGILISPENLKMDIFEEPQGMVTFAQWMIRKPRGIDLLSELAQVGAQYKQLILNDSILVSKLNETKEGTALVKECSEFKEKSVTKNSLFKPQGLLAESKSESKAEPMSDQENSASASNSQDSKAEKICGKHDRDDDKQVQPPAKRQRTG